MDLWVYDIETYRNFFFAAFYNVKTKQWKLYEISDRYNTVAELKTFLLTRPKLIGFNNVNFDYPVIHNTILSIPKLELITPERLYKEAARVISQKYSAIWDNQTLIPQLDLYKIWHYDNKNKSTSLKWLEFAMRCEDVRDLPYPPGSILTFEQMDEVIDYCKHDVLQTYTFYTKSLKHIEIREFYSQKENINLINASEIKIAKEIFAKYLAAEMKISPWDVKKLRTERETVNISDIIFNYIKFNDPRNTEVLNFYKNAVWHNTENLSDKEKEKLAIKYQIPYHNVVRDYAEGGLHSFGQPGIYESNDEYVLIDVDFASFYPHISFKNNLHPEHIPADVFNRIYEGFYHERKNYPKSDPRNYVLKIVLNGSYGLSKDKFSFLYDPKWQLAITVNGQLILTLLTEKICEAVPNVKIIFENTDGAMYYLPRSAVSAVSAVMLEIENITKIPLESTECKSIIARDVNNYINVIKEDYIKFKGAFEIDRDYHKNHSKRIIPIALANYFVYGVDVEYTIKTHLEAEDYPFAKNYGIYDFCIGAKMIGNNKLVQRKLKGATKFGKNDKRELVSLYGYGELVRDFYVKDLKGAKLDDIFDLCYQSSPLIEDVPLSKTTRYIVSNDGYQLIKKMPFLKSKLKSYKKKYKEFYKKKYPSENFDIIDDIEIVLPDRETNIESGYFCTVVNKIKDSTYDINYDYYIAECKKIIDIYEQLT